MTKWEESTIEVPGRWQYPLTMINTNGSPQVVSRMLKKYRIWRNAGWSHSAACQAVITGRRDRAAVKTFLELPEIVTERAQWASSVQV